MLSSTVSESERMDLKTAENITSELISLLKPYLEKYEICGSIRRKKPNIGDIDLVAIPKLIRENENTLYDIIKKIDPSGLEESKKLGKHNAKRYLNGDLIKRFKFKNAIIDLYLADSSTFSVLKLIRTGSKEHNVKLTSLAKQRGLKLFASGKGLCEIDPDGNITKIISNDENEILQILLGKIPSPIERN